MVLHAPILGANQADRQISIDIPFFNEFLFISCTLALIVSVVPQSCSANLTPIIEHFFKEELNRAANAAKHEGLGIDDPEDTKERKDEKRKEEQDLSPQAFVTNFLAAGPTCCRKI